MRITVFLCFLRWLEVYKWEGLRSHNSFFLPRHNLAPVSSEEPLALHVRNLNSDFLNNTTAMDDKMCSRTNDKIKGSTIVCYILN